MNILRRFSGRLAATFTFLVALIALPAAASATTVVELEIKGGIGPATAEYLVSGIEHAEETGADLVLIRMDTPGGLLDSTREIITAILNSEVPVVTYVDPSGSRAASAGTFILLASHVAAMAPTTNVGAATPVSLFGEDVAPDPDEVAPEPEQSSDESESEGEGASESTGEDAEETAPPDPLRELRDIQDRQGSAMERKIMNDTITYVRNLADRHGRNADWAERAVTEAAVLSEVEALEQNVIEFIAADRDELFEKINGHEVTIDSETLILETNDVAIDEFKPSWRIRLLSVLQNPQLILILGLLGFYSILLEFYNPGAIVPGTVGAICLLLALYGVQAIPVNYVGVALILLGIGLMVAEAFAPSFGALGLGGTAAFIFGAILMFDSGIPGFGISIPFVISIALVLALAVILLTGYVIKVHRRGPVYGEEAIVGADAVAEEDFVDGKGKVWLEGESWAARSSVPIAKGDEVHVTALNGLTLDVKPVGATTRAQTAT
ncbi:MAG: nodulation protein NfeD [Woeseiaceae bacterium]|nr:nodulation protein NfeD [Woeseiaceae bacterium]